MTAKRSHSAAWVVLSEFPRAERSIILSAVSVTRGGSAMRRTSWKMLALAAAFALAVTWAARAEDDKDEHKAEDFKGKTFELKAKDGKAHITLTFAEGKKAKITVKSDAKTDVNLYIWDADKKEVAKDDSEGPDCEIV